MDVPESAWQKVVEWFSGFGNGALGLLVLAMVLLTICVCWCVPGMWKEWLGHKKSMKELEPKLKELDLEIIQNVQKLGGRMTLQIEEETGTKKKKESRK